METLIVSKLNDKLASLPERARERDLRRVHQEYEQSTKIDSHKPALQRMPDSLWNKLDPRVLLKTIEQSAGN